jgi:hypothetical protein
MSRIFLITSLCVLWVSSPAAQSQSDKTAPYSFNGDRLGMSLAEFKSLHHIPESKPPDPHSTVLTTQNGPSCDQNKNVARCDYGYHYLGPTSVGLEVDALFVDERLAVLELRPPADRDVCLDQPVILSESPEPIKELEPGINSDDVVLSNGEVLSRADFDAARKSALAIWQANCGQYNNFWQSLKNGLGQPKTIASSRESMKDDPALRWETGTSVAEFEKLMCWPEPEPRSSNEDRQWSKAISEMLEGHYCQSGDDLSARQTVMFYLHKDLSRKIVEIFGQESNQ